MSDPEAVRGLQERAARALPATQIEKVDGWWLRSAPGCAWWVRSVLPHGDAGPDELVRRVAGAEKFYADRGVAARFQISAGACPRGLDAVLAERGYRAESPMSLRAAPTARVLGGAPTNSLRIRLDDRPTGDWFDVWHAVHGHHGGDRTAEWDMLTRVDGPSAYAAAMVGGEIVAVGRAVADTGWVGLFGMATLPEARGRGAARSLLAALAKWAGGHRADRMYLQVERGNVPAVRLYERTGFSEVRGYHYRTAG
ncbi:GNAT family N-acetyltransferase [Plantactinospora solaniradicis]|uniref:GNAT family N-acetyltransferase n=1 Tax=Plantactinospora solaniradicis TaxID=1723736 RepID=A0ABW1K3J6_9ACTN